MDDDLDAEWVALVAAVRGRRDLSRAVDVLGRRHALDEAGAIRRLLWVAVASEVGLPEAAAIVLAEHTPGDTDGSGSPG